MAFERGAGLAINSKCITRQMSGGRERTCRIKPLRLIKFLRGNNAFCITNAFVVLGACTSWRKLLFHTREIF
jgi:hypothetical protein